MEVVDTVFQPTYIEKLSNAIFKRVELQEEKEGKFKSTRFNQQFNSIRFDQQVITCWLQFQCAQDLAL